MVQVVTIGEIDMHIGAGMIAKCSKEFLDQFQFKVTNLGFRQRHVVDQVRPAGKIQHNRCQGFMHRHGATTITANPGLIAQCLFERFTEADAEILNSVMSIDLKVPFGTDLQVEKTMPGNLGQHVIKKRHT